MLLIIQIHRRNSLAPRCIFQGTFLLKIYRAGPLLSRQIRTSRFYTPSQEEEQELVVHTSNIIPLPNLRTRSLAPDQFGHYSQSQSRRSPTEHVSKYTTILQHDSQQYNPEFLPQPLSKERRCPTTDLLVLTSS